jgi:MinD superfamily P-loop ATPase
MNELVVISGKGGTGKTSLMAAFAALAEGAVLCDADVDAPDLHLILDPSIRDQHPFQSGNTAQIRREDCTECGLCRELCRWEAVGEEFRIDPLDCEGCGVCVWFCPEKAIDFPPNVCGEWFVSDTRFGTMVHAKLAPAEENSGKLVALVRQEARKIAEAKERSLLLTDGPPGVGCPVIASLGGATAALVVAEPTVSGVHDLDRVSDLATFFRVPVLVCVNKADINPETAEAIRRTAEQKGHTFVGEIPFHEDFTLAMIQKQSIEEYAPDSEAAKAVRDLWGRVTARLQALSTPSADRAANGVRS